MLIYYLLPFITLFVYWFSTRTSKDLPPTLPGAMPLIGHVHLLYEDAKDKSLWNIVKKLSSNAVQLGGIANIRIGSQIFYVICEPDDFVTVTSTCLGKNYFYNKFLYSWVGDSLVTSSGAEWKRFYQLLSFTFTKNVLYTYIHDFNRQAKSLVSKLAVMSGKGRFDPKEYLECAALEWIFVTMLGLEFNEDISCQMNQYKEATSELLDIIAERITNLWLHNDYLYSWSQLKRKEDAYLRIVNQCSRSWIAKKREEMSNDKTKMDDDREQGKIDCLMALLLKQLEDSTLSDRSIVNQLNSITFAGYHSTATAWIYMLVVIGSHPEVQDRIYNELREVLNGPDQDIAIEDLPKLVYLEAAIKEVLRLYPVAPVVMRYVEKDVKLKNCTLKAGNNCILMLYQINRNKIWGPDSEEFRPERWLQETLPTNSHNYTGFGGGRRVCLGRPNVMMMTKITLAHLFRSYKVTADHTKLKMHLNLNLIAQEGRDICIEPRPVCD